YRGLAGNKGFADLLAQAAYLTQGFYRQFVWPVLVLGAVGAVFLFKKDAVLGAALLAAFLCPLPGVAAALPLDEEKKWLFDVFNIPGFFILTLWAGIGWAAGYAWLRRVF